MEDIGVGEATQPWRMSTLQHYKNNDENSPETDNGPSWYLGIDEDTRPMLGKDFDVTIELLV